MSNQATPGNISRLENQMSQLHSATEHISHEVARVGAGQEQLKSDVLSLHDMFRQYIDEDKRTQAIQTAETRLVKVRQQLTDEYGHYDEVRRRATGVLQAVSAGLVTDDVIQHTTEDVIMRSPNYWLAPALVSIAAFLRGEQDMIQRASTRALDLDASKTALFMSLVMRRSNNDNSLAWLTHYLERQKPSELSREFVVILDAVTTGAFGPSGIDRTSRTVSAWMDTIRQEPGIDDQLSDAWRKQLEGFEGGTTFAYPTLADVCVKHEVLIESLADARSHAVIGGHFVELFARVLPPSRDHEEKVDKILSSLVEEFDEVELPLRRKEVECQAIIDLDGDTEKAKHEADRIGAVLEETQTFPSLLLGAALHPEQSGTTVGTQRLAISLSKDWLVRGYDARTAEIRNRFPSQFHADIEGFAPTLSFNPDEPKVMTALERHFDAETEREIKAASYTPLSIGALVFGVFLFLVAASSASAFAFVIALAALGFGGYGIYQTNQQRELLQRNGDERKKRAAAKMRDTFAEMADYKREWDQADAQAEPTREALLALNPASSGLTNSDQVS